jgi:nucleoside-diphosphate-sugar epimerase
MGKNILLIGGTGILSTDIMLHSIDKGYHVYILNRGYNCKIIPDKVNHIKANIRDIEIVQKSIKDIFFDVVVDFLSYLPSDLNKTLSVFQKHCHQFIFISSACVYRRAKEDGIIHENSPLVNHNWDYSVNKYNCEKLLIEYCNATNLKYTIIRPYITYGNTRIPYGIMPDVGFHWTLIARILSNKPVFVWDDGDVICTLTHTSDFAKGVVGLFNNPKAYDEVFHIVGDERITWKNLIHLTGKILNKEVKIVSVPSSFIIKEMPEIKGMLLGDRCLDAKFDNSKIKSITDFTSTVSIEKGIRNTIEYYKKNNYIKGIDYVWDAKVDRLIDKYLKKTEKLSFNLKFNDYLLNASFLNRLSYYTNRYFPIFITNKFSSLFYHIKRILKNIK